MYSGGWKKFEPVWNFLIKTKNLNNILPVLESVLSKVKPDSNKLVTDLKQTENAEYSRLF